MDDAATNSAAMNEAAMEESDQVFMRMALAQAREAAQAGEVPVGAVLTRNGRELAHSGNRTLADHDPTAHAEVIVMRRGAALTGNHRLTGTTLYVTIEPCAMCAGTIIQARIARLVYGAGDPRGGAVRSCFQLLDSAQLNHRVEVTSGVLAEECAAVLQSFFVARR
jgi:tRNA(adenine34) deaminase